MMNRLPLLLVLFFSTLIPGWSEVRVVGSDLMGKDFVSSVQAYSKRNDLDLKLNLAGSRAGMEELSAGRADLGLLVFSPEEKLPEAPYVAMAIAYHTAVVVVPSTLPLTQISFSQLKSIYSDDAQSGLKRWNDLGVVGSWTHRSILPNITGPSSSITYELFRHVVLADAAYRPTVNLQPDAAAILNRILGDEGGMAVMPMLPANQPKLKTLLVGRNPNDVAFGPSSENIHSGDYPIRLPVYMVFRKESAKRMLTTLRFLLSEDALPLWREAGLVPLPVQARNQLIFDLEVL
jgi:ABC-type phosphate transport system substrate-binding protein